MPHQCSGEPHVITTEEEEPRHAAWDDLVLSSKKFFLLPAKPLRPMHHLLQNQPMVDRIRHSLLFNLVRFLYVPPLWSVTATVLQITTVGGPGDRSLSPLSRSRPRAPGVIGGSRWREADSQKDCTIVLRDRRRIQQYLCPTRRSSVVMVRGQGTLHQLLEMRQLPGHVMVGVSSTNI